LLVNEKRMLSAQSNKEIGLQAVVMSYMVNTFKARGVLRLLMQDNRHLWRVAENISNKLAHTIDMGGDTPATGLSTRQKSALQSV
jgi:hypothetical protein